MTTFLGIDTRQVDSMQEARNLAQAWAGDLRVTDDGRMYIQLLDTGEIVKVVVQ